MNKVKYKTDPIPAMQLVDKPAAEISINATAAMAGMGAATPIAGIVEVPAQEGCTTLHQPDGTDVAFKKIFTVNGHNYLFTSKCCMECIEVKHKKMLRAYLIAHGAVPGLRLWWKVWRATR